MSLTIDNRKKTSLGTKVGMIMSGLVCLLSGQLTNCPQVLSEGLVILLVQGEIISSLGEVNEQFRRCFQR